MNETPRCSHRAGSTQCCLESGHPGGHAYKCAGPYCPGLSWVASNTPHPTSCTIDFEAGRAERRIR